MSSFIRMKRPAIFLLAFMILFSASSCEDKLGQSDIVMETQKVGYEAGSQTFSVQASGKWTLTLFFPDGEPWAELSTTSGSGSKDGIVLSYGENTGNGSRLVRIILTNKGMDAVRNFEQMSRGGAESEAKGIPLWLELPVVSDGLDYYNHHFDKNGKEYRNYSFGWDKENILARWVAYPLNKFYTTKSTDRTDEWGYDPKVPKNQQTDMFSGIGGGYDRGHQIPSADRLCNREANVQTFYFTNMTAQKGAKFNQTIWAALEERVRNYSDASDTLYVVTGCTVGNSIGKYTNDNDGKRLTLPGAYFKALLRFKKGGAGESGYMGAAFYMEHKNYSGNQISSSMMMSIDELERKTGIDFFPNLENVIGKNAASNVEAEDPHDVPFWGIG